MDGVLADFDAHHAAVFGIRSSKLTDDVDWEKVRGITGFYSEMPPMVDMHVLWEYISKYKPILLSGVPSLVEEAAENKRHWARKHLGPDVEVICCKSKDKCLHMKAGDVLIDDWDKYRHLWIANGGHWITHVTAELTIRQLMELGFT